MLTTLFLILYSLPQSIVRRRFKTAEIDSSDRHPGYRLKSCLASAPVLHGSLVIGAGPQ